MSGFYRRKSEVVQAWQINPDSTPPQWIAAGLMDGRLMWVGSPTELRVECAWGACRLDIGDYMIRGADGVIEPCGRSEFERRYEPADAST